MPCEFPTQTGNDDARSTSDPFSRGGSIHGFCCDRIRSGRVEHVDRPSSRLDRCLLRGRRAGCLQLCLSPARNYTPGSVRCGVDSRSCTRRFRQDSESRNNSAGHSRGEHPAGARRIRRRQDAPDAGVPEPRPRAAPRVLWLPAIDNWAGELPAVHAQQSDRSAK